MPTFSRSSLHKLSTCDSRLQLVCNEAIKYLDFSVICGHRNQEEQDLAFNSGNSGLVFPNSKHNKFPSLAVDIVPYPIDWEDRERFYYLAGIMTAISQTMGIKLRWGGDWDMDNDFSDNKFNDLPHFELV